MKKQLMDKLMRTFAYGGAVSERTIKLHGSSIERVHSMFSSNRWVTLSESTISGSKYVRGVIKAPTKPIVMLEPTVFNDNAKYDAAYMTEKLGKYEGNL